MKLFCIGYTPTLCNHRQDRWGCSQVCPWFVDGSWGWVTQETMAETAQRGGTMSEEVEVRKMVEPNYQELEFRMMKHQLNNPPEDPHLKGYYIEDTALGVWNKVCERQGSRKRCTKRYDNE